MSDESVFYTVGCELGEVISTIQESLSDKKVKFSEWVEMGGDAGSLVICLIKNFSVLKENVLDGVSDEERKSFVSGLKEKYDLEDDTLEAAIEDVADDLLAILDSIDDIVDTIKATKS